MLCEVVGWSYRAFGFHFTALNDQLIISHLIGQIWDINLKDKGPKTVNRPLLHSKAAC